MSRLLITVYLSALFFISTSTSAQDYTLQVRHLSVESGLSSRFTLCTYQDAQGFIWIGTQNGLNRWDGYEPVIYTKESHQLPGNQIKQIYEDANGFLWLRFEDVPQIGVFDPIQKQAIDIRDYLGSSSYTTFTAIAQLRNHQLLLATADKRIYQFDGKELKLIAHLPELKTIRQLVPIPSDQSHLWLITQDHHFYYLQIGDTTAILAEQRLKIEESFSFFRVVEVDSSGNFYFAILNPSYTNYGQQEEFNMMFAQGSPKLDKFRSVSLEHQLPEIPDEDYFDRNVPLIHWASEDRWIVLGHPQFRHIDVYNKKGRLLFRSNPIFPKNTVIKNAYFDQNNLLWVSTEDGVYILQLRPALFSRLMYSPPGQARQLSARGMVVWEDYLFGGGYDISGLYQFDLKSGRYKTVHQIQKAIQHYYSGENTVALSVLLDHNKKAIWMGDDNHLIIRYVPDADTLTTYTYKGYEAPILKGDPEQPGAFWALFQDQDGCIWAGTESGLAYLWPDQPYIYRFQQYNGFEDLANTRVTCFLQDEQGIWIGSHKGIFLLSPKEGVLKHYAPKAENFFPFSIIAHLHKDKSGDFWVATKGGGLFRWNPHTGDYQRYRTQEGLTHDILYCVYEDKFNNLWMSSNKGIMQLDKSSGLVYSFLPRDGVVHEEFNTCAHFQAKGGRLYMGGLNGLNAFHPNDFRVHTINTTPLRITQLSKWDSYTGQSTTLERREPFDEPIHLKGSQRNLYLKFALLNYFDAQQNQYAYRIKGLAPQWNYIQENSIRLVDLPYGEYTLEIKAQGTQGNWGKPISIPIWVIRPIYLQMWFWILILMLLIILTWGLLRWRIHLLKQSKKKLEQEVKLRTLQIEKDKATISQQAEQLRSLDKVKNRFFANISHELRTPITLILSPIEILLQQEEVQQSELLESTLEVMRRNTQQLLNLVEEILDLTKLDAVKLEISETPTHLFTYIQQIFSSFQSQASLKQIEYTLSYELDKALWVRLDQKKVEKIINNLLSNALKFTPKNQSVHLSVEKTSKDQLLIIVQDTGVGIDPQDLPFVFERFYQSKLPNAPVQGGSGIGLALSKELASLLKGRIEAESNPKQGSIFRLWLPLVPTVALSSHKAPILDDSPEVLDTLAALKTALPEAPHHILVAEDHPDMQLFIQQILSPYFKVSLVDHGAQALQLLEQQPDDVDLILSDYMMPEMDGIQFLSTVKQDPRFQHLPCVLLTARSSSEDRITGFRIGIDDYITKPFSPEELIVRLQNLLLNAQNRQKIVSEMHNNIGHDNTEITEWIIKPIEEHSEEELIWLQQVEELVLEHYVNSDFSVEWLAAQLHISARQLQRQLQKLTGLTPRKYITEIRMQQARALLEQKKYSTVAQVMYAVGFQSSSYFAQKYRERFGITPSAYFE